MRFKWEAARVECFCMRESPVGGKILEYFKFLLKSVFLIISGLCVACVTGTLCCCALSKASERYISDIYFRYLFISGKNLLKGRVLD